MMETLPVFGIFRFRTIPPTPHHWPLVHYGICFLLLITAWQTALWCVSTKEAYELTPEYMNQHIMPGSLLAISIVSMVKRLISLMCVISVNILTFQLKKNIFLPFVSNIILLLFLLLLLNWGLLLVTQESNVERQVSGKRKENFMEEAGSPGEKVGSCPKEPTPPCWSVGRAFKGEVQGCRGGEGAPCRNSTVSSDLHLEIGHAVLWPPSSWLF